MKYHSHTKKLVVFSQWSGKAYSIFASLGKIIKIARVSIDISDKGLFKKTTLKRSLNDILCDKRCLNDLLDQVPPGEGVLEVFMLQLNILLNRNVTCIASGQKAGQQLPYYISQYYPGFILNNIWIFLFSKLREDIN